ncbi:MAG: glycosyltransferase family 2 protein, partial [Jannaschia sp.]
MTSLSVTVIVAAHNCAPTIDRAIASALEQAETAEVIVVDDASSDDTVVRAGAWTERDGRVHVISLSENAGPAGARNRAMDAATGDVLAILDSDDFFGPGRLAHLLGDVGWDMAADNVVFVREDATDTLDFAALPGADCGFDDLGLGRFVRGNLSDGLRARGEMGFLKPLMDRRFLERNGLRYDPSLRLGEDYDLYMRMLLAGARFRVTLR